MMVWKIVCKAGRCEKEQTYMPIFEPRMFDKCFLASVIFGPSEQLKVSPRPVLLQAG